MRFIKRMMLGLGLFALPIILHAQSTAPDSIVQVTAENQGLSLIAREDLPRHGTFWLVCSNGSTIPMPSAPADQSLPVYAISDTVFLADGTRGMAQVNPHRAGYGTVADVLNVQADAVVNLVDQTATTQMLRPMMRAMGMDSPSFQTDSTDANGFSNDADNYNWDTNQLWLEITNVTTDTTFANLHNATNQVYAIWSTTNIATPLNSWQVATELWPTDTNCQPFTVQNFGGQNQYFRAEDWTDIDSDGDGIPDWWIFKFFGDLSETATNLDADGNTFGYDYTNGLNPNLIQFSVAVANNYSASPSVPVTLNIAFGLPSYYAVLVDNTNFNDAVWNNYASPNLAVNLGLTEGWHEVWLGLRGHADTADEAVWQWKRLKLDFTAPQIVLTSPTNSSVNVPVIQLTGFSPEALGSISYDLSNAVVTVTNQPVLITDQTYSVDSFEFTTNHFQGFDIGITNGVNTFTLHATDLAGNVTSLTTNFTLDYSNKPAATIQSIWPQDGMKICGSSFVWHGTVSDPTASVAVQTVDGSGITNLFHGAVGRDGKFWVQNLPLNSGTNYFTLTATDVAGNLTTTNIAFIQGDAGLTIDPIPHNQTTVTGGINSTNFTIWVNGIQATITGNRWEADNVPIPPNNSLVQVTAIPNGGGQ